MSAVMDWLMLLPAPAAALIGVAFATAGWLYAARRARSLSRKQHTFNALLSASFNKQFQDAQNAVRPHTLVGKFPDLSAEEHKELRDHTTFLLNHYEFLAAGIRNGDISERLLKDSEKGTIIRLVESSYDFISKTRDKRNRKATFEHLDWLSDRWHESPPATWHCCIEWVLARPLYYKNSRWWILAVLAAVIVIFAVMWLHLPGQVFGAPPPPAP